MTDKTRQEITELLKRAITLLQEETVVEQTAVSDEKPVTLEDVRALLVELSRAGQQTKVQELIKGRGVSKLSEVDPKDFGQLMAEAEELLNE